MRCTKVKTIIIAAIVYKVVGISITDHFAKYAGKLAQPVLLNVVVKK